MDEKHKVSIIIPTWNREEDLQRCLIAIKKINYTNLEIIIVENGSTDNTIKMLQSLSLNMKIIQNNKNLGASFAKNQGATISTGDYLWFMDSDTEVLYPNCLKEMIRILNNYPDVAMVGGDIVEERGQRKYKLSRYSRFGMGTIEFRNEDEFQFIECNFITTANCLVRRAVFFEIGGFNPEYFYGGEDTDLCRKIINKGYKGIVDNKTAILHYVSITQRSSNLFLQEKNRIRRYCSHENIFLFPLIPFLDMYFLLKKAPYFFNQIKKRDIGDTALFKKNTEKNIPNTHTFQIVVTFFLSFMYGYLYNIVILPRTLFIRWVYKNNFLNINSNHFNILEIKNCRN